MDEGAGQPANTREFMAMWNTVTADHLSHKLSGALQQLAGRVPGTPRLDEAGAGALAPLLVRALQVAASPEGGVHAAVQFLTEVGGDSAV
jgi:hypothetical protein